MGRQVEGGKVLCGKAEQPEPLKQPEQPFSGRTPDGRAFLFHEPFWGFHFSFTGATGTRAARFEPVRSFTRFSGRPHSRETGRCHGSWMWGNLAGESSAQLPSC